MLLRKTVDSNNSCLFNSVDYCTKNGELNEDEDPAATNLRQVIAGTVASDPERYNEAMLGRTNSDYVEWIMKPDSWGGGIELSILSDFYGLEISVLDIQSLSVSSFGEDKNYTTRIIILYDGIHYDPLYMDNFDENPIRTIFPTTEATVIEQALQLGREARATHQFTDLANFTLKCDVCGQLLKGQTEAQAHAKDTTHASFSEVTK